jgi:O-antigen/teichoic acid export membrane protein
MRKEVSRVFKDSTIYGLGAMIARAVGVVLTPIYTTYLTRSDYGVMSFVLMLSSMAGTLMFLGQTGSLILYYRPSSEDAEHRRELLFNVFWFTMAFGGVLLAICYALGPRYSYLITGSKAIPFYPYLSIGLLIAYLGLPQAMQQAINRAQGQAKLYTGLALAGFAINTLFTIYFVVSLRQGAYGSLKGNFAAAVILLPIALVIIVRRWKPRFSARLMWRSLRYGLPLVPHYFAGWALTYIDRVLLMQLSTAAQVGLYSLAYNVSMVLNLFCASINTAWAPIYYDLADTADGRAKLPRLTTVYAAVVTAIAISYTLVAPDLLLLLANKRFHAAVAVVPVVAGGYYFFALYMVVSTPIFHRKKTVWAPVISGSAALLNVGVNLVLIPRFGMFGAAWATFIAYFFMFLIARVLSERLSPGIYENRSLIVLIGTYCISLAAAIVLVEIGLPIVIDLLIKAALVPLLFALLFLFRIATPAEVRAMLRRPKRRRPMTESDEAEIAARQTAEVAASTDDTGFAPDNRP